MNHVTYVGVMSHMNETCHIWVMSHMNESYHIWMRHVTCEWVMSHMNESCHIWMSHVTGEWVMSHMNDSCHISMRHVPWNHITHRMKSLTESCHVSTSEFARAVCADKTRSCVTWLTHRWHSAFTWDLTHAHIVPPLQYCLAETILTVSCECGMSHETLLMNNTDTHIYRRDSTEGGKKYWKLKSVSHMNEPRHTEWRNIWVVSHTSVLPRSMSPMTRRGGGLGSSTIFKNLMSPTPRRKWYLTTGRRAH